MCPSVFDNILPKKKRSFLFFHSDRPIVNKKGILMHNHATVGAIGGGSYVICELCYWYDLSESLSSCNYILICSLSN